MKIPILVLITCLLPLVAGADKETCQITLAENKPVAATGALPVSSNSSHAWYGSEALAALIPKNGIWTGMGPEHDFGDKFWWWRLGYDAQLESNFPQADVGKSLELTMPLRH